eukprot:TRINITY_DN31723_c0_g1_i1.p1 TRINITY_DN31723_c0_g1~~TRINITY_DN31723_c0_g1_i1.p1  ORF type:complete len:111 (+),score=11.57 TRINITY_DN31723_c0_g1_i1:60-392(+)
MTTVSRGCTDQRWAQVGPIELDCTYSQPQPFYHVMFSVRISHRGKRKSFGFDVCPLYGIFQPLDLHHFTMKQPTHILKVPVILDFLVQKMTAYITFELIHSENQFLGKST